MRQRTRIAALGTLATLAFALTGTARAADQYPSHPVTIVIPFSPGGDSDLAARNLAAHVSKYLGVAMVPLNKAGAGGAIGSQFAHDATPDGYTLLLARVGSQAVLPALQKSLTYRWNDFTFLGLLELNPMACVVNAKSPYHKLSDLMAAIKARPGQLNYSTSGPATVLNLAAQTLLSAAGLSKDAATQIPYKGGGDATTAVIAGQVDFSCANLTSLIGAIKGKQVRALVTTSPQRLRDLPDIPTAREVHYPQLESVNGWSALYGPPGLSKQVQKKWEQTLAELSKDKGWIQGEERLGSVPHVLPAKATHKYVAEQYEFYVQLGKKLGLELK